MLKSYLELREYLPQLNSIELENYLLSPEENSRTEALFETLRPLESVSKILQDDKPSVSDVRTLFDYVIDKYPETATRLKANADIVLNLDFENAIVKVQRDNIRGLSWEESLSISRLI